MGKQKKNNNYVGSKKEQRRQEFIKKQKQEKIVKITVLCVALALLLALIIAGFCAIFSYLGPDSPEEGVNSQFKATHHATIVVKNYGTIHLELYGEEAPETVNNFVKLANEGWYDGLTFHRVMKDFMAQGGCPEGNGSGNYKDADGKTNYIKGEFSANGVNNDIKHIRGTISMARGGYSMDSASCQFFIVHETNDNTTLSLDGKYAAFGMVTDGMRTIDKIINRARLRGYSEVIDNPKHQPIIESITIHEAHD